MSSTRIWGCDEVNIPRDRKLRGLQLFTDETGILQHSKFGVIDRRHGYTTDDNARALVAAIRYGRKHGGESALKLAETYLEFLLYAHIEGDGYHNLIGYDKSYHDERGTEDSIGHAIWAVGYTVNSKVPTMMRQTSRWLLDESFPTVRRFTSPRGKALTLLGLCEYANAYPEEENIRNEVKVLSEYLVHQFKGVASDDWRWFETCLTYANARIPQALFEAANVTGDKEYLNIAKNSIDFLIETQFSDWLFVPVGNNGWYNQGGRKAMFDQQPIEAVCMVDAAMAASKSLKEEKYLKVAQQAFAWFQGENVHGVKLVDDENYTCYDGLTPRGLNENMGAESTISYLMADLALETPKAHQF
jgi:hypothetical protein